MTRSIITRENAAQESIGWNHHLPVPADPEVHMSNLRITTNGIETVLIMTSSLLPHRSSMRGVMVVLPTEAGPDSRGLPNSKYLLQQKLPCARKATTPNWQLSYTVDGTQKADRL